ncbi:TRM11 family SAM-dependent methyltransferase [Actinophytocola sp. KF-1]
MAGSAGRGVHRAELKLSAERFPRLTHYMFRYPAKFHPPVVTAILNRYTHEDNVVLDPFVGSGTLLVEAAVTGRIGLGVDVDPLAVAVARAKTYKYNVAKVKRAAKTLLERLASLERPEAEYVRFMHSDITAEQAEKVAAEEGLLLPAIPNLQHWFRSYVVVDLARILAVIRQLDVDRRTRDLLLIAFASIIRKSSNADPVPVSGLEYTSHMKQRDAAGRLVNPYALLRIAVKKIIEAVEEWAAALPNPFAEPRVWVGDAKKFPRGLPHSVDAIVTSPPYHNAVDYYRRHQLEMFWLDLTVSHLDRLQLLPNYIGRPHIAAKDPLLQEPWEPGPLAAKWEKKIRVEHPKRAGDFRHYVTAMRKVFAQMATRLSVGSPAIFVVGESQWNGEVIPTARLFTEISEDQFTLDEVLSYPIKNRYMSYSRHNQASIDREYVVVFRRH